MESDLSNEPLTLNSQSINDFMACYNFSNTIETVWEFSKDPMTLFYLLYSHHIDISTKVRFPIFPLIYDLYSVNTLNYGNDISLEINNNDIVNMEYFKTASFLLKKNDYYITKITILVHYLDNKKTLFSIYFKRFNCSQDFNYKNKRKIISKNINFLFSYIEKMDYSSIFNNSVVDVHSINSSFSFCAKFFKNSIVMAELLGEVKYVSCEEIKQGTLIKIRVKDEEKDQTIQVKDFFSKGKMINFYSNIYSGQNSSPYKINIIKVYSIDNYYSNITYFAIVTKFYQIATKKQIDYAKRLHKKFSNKIINLVEKFKLKEILNNENENLINNDFIIPNVQNQNNQNEHINLNNKSTIKTNNNSEGNI